MGCTAAVLPATVLPAAALALYCLLLQVVLFHHHALEAMGEDELLELADWTIRKLTYLNTEAHKHVKKPGE